MKCPVCMNDGEEYAFVTCNVGAIYNNVFFYQGSLAGEAGDEYEEDELVLVTCGQCSFTGLPELFEEGVELPEIKKDDRGFYMDDFESQIGSCTVRGKLYLDDQVAKASQKVHRIHHAASVDELPEVLCDESEQLRELAAAKFRELGGSANGNDTGTRTE